MIEDDDTLLSAIPDSSALLELTKASSFRETLERLSRLDKSEFASSLKSILLEDARAMGVARVSLWKLRPDRSAIDCETLMFREGTRHPSALSLSGAQYPKYFVAVRESRSIVAHDAANDPRTSEFADGYFAPNGITSMLDVPVWHAGKLYGVVCHEHVGPPRRWTSEEQDFALGIAELVAVALEIQQRRWAEERFTMLSQVSAEVIWEADLVTGHLQWAKGAAAALRIDPAELGDTCDWWLSRVHPDEVDRVRTSFRAACTSGEQTWTDEYRLKLGDGSWAVFVDRAFVAHDAQGKPARMVGAMSNVTVTRQLQAKLALSDRMASVGTLAAGMAHEVNNPLAFISANLEFIKEELASAPPELRSALEDAMDGARRIRDVVSGLSAFSRADESVKPLDVQSVIRSSLRMAWNEVRHRATLVEEYAEAPPVMGNDSRLGQVLVNLVVNAAHAMTAGKRDTNKLWVRLRKGNGEKAVIEVEDTGPGIPHDLRGRVFDPFFTTKAIGEGTGLGLSICHGIVSAMRGEIELLDGAMGGCLVRVTLPAAHVVEQTVARVEGASPTARLRVLVVDDEAQVTRALERTLRNDHEVKSVTAASEALEVLRSGARYDVVLCDVMMPQMTGPEFRDEARARGYPEAERFIFVTGGTTRDLLAPTDAMLVKPYDSRQLREVIAATARS